MKIPGNDVVDDTLVDKLLDFIKYISAEKKGNDFSHIRPLVQ